MLSITSSNINLLLFFPDLDRYNSDCDNDLGVTDSLLREYPNRLQSTDLYNQDQEQSTELNSPLNAAKLNRSTNPFSLKYEIHAPPDDDLPSSLDQISISGSSAMLDHLQAAAASLEHSSFLQPSLGGTSIHSSRSKSNRINRISGMTSSSSATSSTSNAANREKRSLQSNLKNFTVQNNSGGDESDRSLHSEPPPEPAPPEIPPRTQSLLMSLRKKSDYQLKFEDNGDQKHEQFIPASQIGKFPPFYCI